MHEVGQHADEVSDLANEHGFPLWSASAMFYRGLWLTADGQARRCHIDAPGARSKLRYGAGVILPI
jgi:hypothetical protein